LIDLNEFPTTRYQGSKRKILPWLHNVLQDLEFETVLDACGGSGIVSYLFKKMGKTVTYNDKLHFNYLMGKALIENQRYKLNESDIENLSSANPQLIYNDFIQTTFEGIYYLQEENQWLDVVSSNIINMNHYRPHVLEYKKALAYYALFQSSMIKRPFNLFHRKNLEIRTNDVERNFGNKTTWEKPFKEYFTKFANEANNLIFNSNKQCRAFNESILDINPDGYDLVYIDPPYIRQTGSNESSDYLRCYHFLEGLSKYAEWENLIDYNSMNLRLKDISDQNDFTKENIYQVFEEILVKFIASTIVFSYKQGGIPSIEFITSLLKKLGKHVYTISMHYQYALSHQNDDLKNREVLIIAL
jgi:adenine-specific DNA-methyltransferase